MDVKCIFFTQDTQITNKIMRDIWLALLKKAKTIPSIGQVTNLGLVRGNHIMYHVLDNYKKSKITPHMRKRLDCHGYNLRQWL
jgi:hypothetical protein